MFQDTRGYPKITGIDTQEQTFFFFNQSRCIFHHFSGSKGSKDSRLSTWPSSNGGIFSSSSMCSTASTASSGRAHLMHFWEMLRLWWGDEWQCIFTCVYIYIHIYIYHISMYKCTNIWYVCIYIYMFNYLLYMPSDKQTCRFWWEK